MNAAKTIYIRRHLKSTYGEAMAINVNNEEADKLTRKFASLAGVSLTDAIVIAMKEAIERRRGTETPLQTARRIRRKHNVVLNEQARATLPRETLDDMWDD